jgi:hypothetical protein
VGREEYARKIGNRSREKIGNGSGGKKGNR